MVFAITAFLTLREGKMKKKLNQVKTFFSKPYNILLVLFLIVLTYLVVFPLFSIVKDTFIVHSAEKSRDSSGCRHLDGLSLEPHVRQRLQ